MKITKLSPELEEMRKEVEEVARKCNLDFFPVQFHALDFAKLNEVIANLGFPRRYVHWRFGMEFGKLMKELGYGFGKIYELVINTNPAIAYLLSYNKKIQQKMVMAHVYGHVDFFKNNLAFADTNRNMFNTMADHAEIISYYYKKHGFAKVEEFIDACLSIENLVDPFFDQIQKPEKQKDRREREENNKEHPENECPVEVEPYMSEFVKNLFKKPEKKQKEEKQSIFKKNGDRDVLKFIIDNADHLEDWQKDILSIIREERCYFIPQIKTKIINEGWATFWHSYIMSKMGLAGDAGIIKYAKTHAGVIGNFTPPKGKISLGFNPYTLGFMLFNDIKERWDRGMHGLEYENERDVQKRQQWDTGEMKGLEKIFEVRKYKTDEGFIREFFTDEFIIKNLFFTYGPHPIADMYDVIKSRQPEKIRNALLEKLTNYGEPIIEAVDANFRNSRFLLLKHKYLGEELHPYYTEATLKNIQQIWKRPVFLTTYSEDKPVIIGCDEKKIKKKKLKK